MHTSKEGCDRLRTIVLVGDRTAKRRGFMYFAFPVVVASRDLVSRDLVSVWKAMSLRRSYTWPGFP